MRISAIVLFHLLCSSYLTPCFLHFWGLPLESHLEVSSIHAISHFEVNITGWQSVCSSIPLLCSIFPICPFTPTFHPSPPDLWCWKWTLLITLISSFASKLDLSDGRHQGKSRAQENNVGVLISFTPPLLTAHVVRVGWQCLTTEDHLPLTRWVVGGGGFLWLELTLGFLQV